MIASLPKADPDLLNPHLCDQGLGAWMDSRLASNNLLSRMGPDEPVTLVDGTTNDPTRNINA